MFDVLAQEAPPAGGAALGEVAIAALISLVVIAPTLWVLWRELDNKPTLIGRFADWVASKDGYPRWVGLPVYVLVVSLLLAGFGVWWDVPLHMQNGRDEGPLANPSHYPIFLGILLVFNAGILSMALARKPLPRRTVQIIPGLRAPMGALAVTGAGLIALIGFPADDLWHRLFGQDVTEWGPTHVMMIGGVVTGFVGGTLLLAEGRQVAAANADGTPRKVDGLLSRFVAAVCMSLAIAPFAFLMEFDLGVPQFPLATQFIIAAFLAGWIFTAVRAYFGPGGALLAWFVYFLAHLYLWGTVAALPGVLTASFLLLLPAAVLVEVVALVLSPRRGYAFWIVSGVLVGSIGMYAEWLWTKVVMPLPQPMPSDALPLMLGVGTVAAVGGGLLGAWMVRQIQATQARTDDEVNAFVDADYRSFGQRHLAGIVGFGLFVALMAYFAPQHYEPFQGTVRLDYQDGATAQTCGGTSKCMALVTVDLQPSDVAEQDRLWFYALAWQGRHRSTPDLPGEPGAPGILRVEMVSTGTPGQYRTAKPLPLYGSWKTLIRVHSAPTTMAALPLYAPDDPAITSQKGRKLLVQDGQTVQSMSEPGFLQREIKDDVPSWLWNTAYTVVGFFWAALIAFYGWCYAAAARRTETAPSERRSDTKVTQ